MPVFNGAALPERPIFFEHQAARALIRGDWKLVWGKRMPHKIQWELYNLKTDRCETKDVAARNPARVKQMSDEWLRYAKRVKLFPFYKSPGVGGGKSKRK